MGLFRRRVMPWNEAQVLRNMLIEMYMFIQDNLEEDSHPMEAYFVGKTEQEVATILTRVAWTRRLAPVGGGKDIPMPAQPTMNLLVDEHRPHGGDDDA